MKTITWDLETIANRQIIPHLPPVEPDSRLKDPVKIEANLLKKKEKQIAELGLSPSTCRICVFGWCDENGKTNSIILQDETDKAEKELVQKAWEVLADAEKYVTFNGNNFDIPILKFRSLINKVRPAVQISTRKYTIENHIDVRAVLTNYDPHAKGSLDWFSKILLGKAAKDGMSGDLVQEYWNTGFHNEIAEYCKKDTLITWELYKLVEKFYIL